MHDPDCRWVPAKDPQYCKGMILATVGSVLNVLMAAYTGKIEEPDPTAAATFQQ